MILDSIEQKDFQFGQKACLQLYYKPEILQKFFKAWFEKVREGEKDLVLARFIMMKMALNKIA